jgi:hypothetical protein
LSFFGVLCGDALNVGAPADGSVTSAKLAGGLSVGLTGGSASTPSLFFTGDANTGLFSPTADTIAFAEGGSEAMRIDSSGRLLVGTSTARSNFYGGTTDAPQFQIEGTTYNTSSLSVTLNENATTAPRIILGKSRGTTIGSNTVVQSGDQVGVIIYQGSDGSSGLIDAARIACEVDATPGAGDMPGRLVFSTTADGASSPTERMRITNSGTVLVGRTTNTSISSGAALQPSNLAVEVGGDVTGSWWNRTDSNAAWVAQRFHAQGTLTGFIQVNTSSVTYSTTSDYRLKENVVPLTGAIDRLQQIPVHRFNFIADPGNTVDGFIAHEAQAVVPECATGEKDAVDEEGNPVYQGIDQSKLVPLLTAALQEAIAEIASLKDRVAALEGA